MTTVDQIDGWERREGPVTRALLGAFREVALAKGPLEKLKALRGGAASMVIPIHQGRIEKTQVVDELREQALRCGLADEDAITAAIAAGLAGPST